MGKIFIIIGFVIIILGILIHFFSNKFGWFGNLYGDIKLVKSNYGFYFPLTSMLIISVIMTIIINIFNRFIK